MTLSSFDRLRLCLRPPGRGIYTVSSGGGAAASLLKAMYGTDVATQVATQWEDSLQKIRRVDTLILGLPSDVGAGVMRGANFGPIGIRAAYFNLFGQYPKGVVDVGDILVVPQLLHDEMLSESQLEATRSELFPGVAEPLPVSPLSMAESVLMALHELNPTAQIILLGGDHSVSWPAMRLASHRFGEDFGILHFDAHTDLLPSRLGVKYCFATWAYHAMKLVKPYHLVQVGIRASAKPKEHWIQTYPVVQYWAQEVKGREDEVIAEILKHFSTLKVRRLYISNDIDGTDAAAAPATGTPENNGLAPVFVARLIEAARQEFEIIGSDVVEVAPPLSGVQDFSVERTCVLAAHYLQKQIGKA